MDSQARTEPGSWRTLVIVAAIAAPLFAVLWLGITLTTHTTTLTIAVVKIVFTIIAVVTAACGVRWATAAGIALLIEGIAVVAWIVLKVETYPPYGALRTGLLLAAPLAIAGILFVLADGIKAGTWPPARFRATTEQ
jgi:hypothetical protein